jgi:hypothetical protein
MITIFAYSEKTTVIILQVVVHKFERQFRAIISFIQNCVEIRVIMWAVSGKNGQFMLCLQPETGENVVFMLAK